MQTPPNDDKQPGDKAKFLLRAAATKLRLWLSIHGRESPAPRDKQGRCLCDDCQDTRGLLAKMEGK